MMSWAVAAALLLVLVIALAVYCMRLSAQIKELIQRLADQDTEQHQHVRDINKRLDAYLEGSIGMGEELRALSELVAPLPGKVNQIEQRDPSGVSFTQAARLVGMGASADDIAQSCGLSRGEAELVSRLNMPKP